MEILKLGRKIEAIREIGKAEKQDQMAGAKGKKVELLPRGTIVMAMILAAMFAVPFIMRQATKFMESRQQVDGRGTGAVVGGVRVPGTRTGVDAGLSAVSGALREGQYKIFYAPDTDLEQEDLEVIGSAQSSIDAALYSDTDKPLCDAMAEAARRRVRVRVYRDREQYTDEEKRAGGRETCTEELVASGAEVKVKADGEDLMHLKSYEVDGHILRSGAANLSVAGEKREDNDAVFLASVTAAKGFESQFARIWERGTNEAVAAPR